MAARALLASRAARAYARAAVQAHRRVGAILVVVAIAGSAGAATAAAFEPIEGVWRIETSTRGEFLIQQRGPRQFVRTIIQGNRDCRTDESGFRARVGEATPIAGGKLDYTLRPVFRSQTCRSEGIGQGIIRIVSTDPQNYRQAACSARPGTGPPQYDANFRPTSSNTICRVAVRIRPPRRPVRARDVVKVPRVNCTRRARQFGRRVRLRLANPANEPVESAVVRLGKRALYRYRYPGTLRRSVLVRLPRRAARVRVVVKTTSNKSLASGRRYGACALR